MYNDSDKTVSGVNIHATDSQMTSLSLGYHAITHIETIVTHFSNQSHLQSLSTPVNLTLTLNYFEITFVLYRWIFREN